MTTARCEIVDVAVTRWYHCISKCVRSAFLMADDAGNDRKKWIEDRLKMLAENFSVALEGFAVMGFAVMDNHLHVLCRLDPEHAKSWSPEYVIKRWISVYPPRDLDLDHAEIVDKWVEHHARDAKLVDEDRDSSMAFPCLLVNFSSSSAPCLESGHQDRKGVANRRQNCLCDLCSIPRFFLGFKFGSENQHIRGGLDSQTNTISRNSYNSQYD